MAEKTSARKHLDTLGYNPTATGLGALAQGIQSARQQNIQNAIAQQQLANQTQQLKWEDPNRAPTELDRLKVNPYQLQQAQMMQQMFNSFPKQPDPNAPPVQQASPAPAQAATNGGQASGTTPAPVQSWMDWEPEDFMAYKDEMKKRAAKRTT